MGKPKRKKATGATRMRENGMWRVEVWLDASEVLVITRAAELVGRKVATFVREAAFGSGCVVVEAEQNHQNPDSEFWEKMTRTLANRRAPGV